MNGSQTHGDAIVVRGLTKRYDEVQALNGVDLVVPANTIYALLGPNGAGKTTTISILTTMTRPTSGEAQVAGIDVLVDAAAVRRRIGVTFQETVLDDALTGRQVLDYHGRLYGQSRAERKSRIAEMLALVELEAAADRRTKTYSGGMKRRLELVRGLMTEPEIFFLDEPTLGLDPQNRAAIWEYIRHLKTERGMTLLLTTHYMDEAEQLADCVGIVNQGRIVAEDTPRALVDQMGDDVIRVAGQGDAAAFLAAAHDLAYVADVSMAEGLIQLGVDHGNRRLADVVTTAQAAGYTIEDISVAKPTLGDVFLKVTGRQFRDDES